MDREKLRQEMQNIVPQLEAIQLGDQSAILIRTSEPPFDQSVTTGDESLQEVVHLAYGSVQMTINGMDPTGKITAGTPVGWNQVTNNQAWDEVVNQPV